MQAHMLQRRDVRHLLLGVGVAHQVDGATRALADLTDDGILVLDLIAVLRLHDDDVTMHDIYT